MKLNVKRKILVIGDSHTHVFNYINKNHQNIFDVIRVDGATAQGAVNPNSKTNALNIFKRKLSNCKGKYSYIIIVLGEVDCGFVIWYRAKKYNISVNNQLNKSVTNLFNFIHNEVKRYFSNDRIILLGSILPTIADNVNKKFLNGARSSVTNSQQQRTKLTLRYNNELKERCTKNGYNYIDITEETMNKKSGLVANKFKHEDKFNHHLSSQKTHQLWLNKLSAIINS